MKLVFWLGGLALMISLLLWWRSAREARRADYIRHYAFPKGLYARLQARHPQLDRKQCELVGQGLRQFFLAYLRSGRQPVSMPSQVADDLWHEFIVYTRNYELFCRQAFGRFLHHTPAVVLAGGAAQSNAGLRRVWTWTCREENIDPRHPSRLPLLFALDAKLAIPNGFAYVPDCTGVRRAAGDTGSVHCGGSFSDSRIDGGTDGFGDGGGDGSGDGGGGCGGGD